MLLFEINAGINEVHETQAGVKSESSGPYIVGEHKGIVLRSIFAAKL